MAFRNPAPLLEDILSAPPAIKILMAEDNLINQRVGKLILQRAGYSVDLVVDGFEATEAIRGLPAPQPVIIAVTANAMVGERERCLDGGMDDYLSKPFQPDELVAIVGKWTRSTVANRG